MDTNIIILYLLIMFITIQMKPKFLFKPDGNIRRFGVSKEE